MHERIISFSYKLCFHTFLSVCFSQTALPLAVEKADDFEAYLPGPGVDALVDAVEAYIERIMSFAHQLIVHVAHRLAHDMAKCGLVWDMYDGFTGIICVYFLDAFVRITMSSLYSLQYEIDEIIFRSCKRQKLYPHSFIRTLVKEHV